MLTHRKSTWAVGPRCGALLALTLVLGACHASGDERWNAPGNRADTHPFSGIGPEETLHVAGTEPFWGGTITDGVLLYKSADNPAEERISVSRFAGRGGLSFSGTRAGKEMTLAVTPGECSDGMSDRAYPLVVTLLLGEETRAGCAWSARHPFKGSAAP